MNGITLSRMGGGIGLGRQQRIVPLLPAPDAPVVIADFANDVYKINGATVTMADVVEDRSDVWEAFHADYIEPGVGLAARPTSLGNNRQTAPALTAAAATGLTPFEGGFTGLFDYRFEGTTTDTGDAMSFIVQMIDDPAWTNQINFFHSAADGGGSVWDFSGTSGKIDSGAGPNHKLALTLTASLAAFSIDGGPVAHYVPGTPAILDMNLIGFYVHATSASVLDQLALLRSAQFYAPVMESVLPTMSALA